MHYLLATAVHIHLLITYMKTSLSQFFEDKKNLSLSQEHKDKIYHQFLSNIDNNFSDNNMSSDIEDNTSWLDVFYVYLRRYVLGYRLAVAMLLIVVVMFSSNIKDFIINNYIPQDTVYADSIGQIIKVDGKYAVMIDNTPYMTNKIYDWSIIIVQPWSQVDFIVNEKIVWNISWPAKLSFKKVNNEYALNLLEWDKLELHTIKKDNISDTTTTSSDIDTMDDTDPDTRWWSNNQIASEDMKLTITTTKFIAKATDSDIDLKVSTHGNNQIIQNQNGSIEVTNSNGDKSVLLASNQYAVIDSEIKLFADMAKLANNIWSITSQVTTPINNDQWSLDKIDDIYSAQLAQNNTDQNTLDTMSQSDTTNDLSISTATVHDPEISTMKVALSDMKNENNIQTNSTIDQDTDIKDIDTTISQDTSIDMDQSSRLEIGTNQDDTKLDDIYSKKQLLSKEQLSNLKTLSSNYIPWWSLLPIKDNIMRWCRLFGVSCMSTDDQSTLKIYLQRIFKSAKEKYYITDDINIVDIK